MTDRPELPPALRDAIARDLAPVSPLPPPARRLLAIVPLALLLLVASVVVFGLRRDAPRLGIALTWIASTLQAGLGLALIGAALRDAVPGTTLTRRTIAAIAAAASVTIVAITALTWMVSPTRIAPGFAAYVWGICVAGTTMGALPIVAVAAWLVSRAFPLRPMLVGALSGLGGGLIADAGWRLFCHFSDPLHVFGAHTLGVALASLIALSALRLRA
jgi:hypothetical protein